MFLRVTPLFILWPNRFLNPEATRGLDIDDWSARFTWEKDAWNGWKDTVDPVSTIIAAEAGDCDDYAAVVASWAHALGKDASLLLCWESGTWLPTPDHIAVVVDDHVYSSGVIREVSPAEYVEQSRYSRFQRRSID